MTPFIFVVLLIIQLLFLSHSSCRRILHQPFFPVTDQPPPPPPPPTITTQPPSPSPSPQPQHQPKHPFSSLTPPLSPTHHHRFFPFYTTPPTTTTTTTTTDAFTSTSLPTFPANISSTIHQSSPPSTKSHVSKKLLFLSLSLSLLSVAFIAAVLASLLYHRNHNHNHKPLTSSSSDSRRLFPANLPTSDKPPPPAPPSLSPNFSTHSSEFLYLGTLSHIPNASPSPSASAAFVYERMGSPELHPLPPLPRNESLFSSKEFPDMFQHDITAAPPPPPPPPPPPELPRKEKPKLKGLHWDKIKSSSEKTMVWDQLKKSSSFQYVNDMRFIKSSSNLLFSLKKSLLENFKK